MPTLKLLSTSLFVLLCFISVYFILNILVKEAPSKIIYNEKLKEIKADRPDLAYEQYVYMAKDPKMDRVTPERLGAVKKEMYGNPLKSDPENSSVGWIERGPDNVGGRTRAVLIDMRDSSGNTVWAGGVSGGLWKTTNFMQTNTSWQPIDDFFASIAISCIVQDPQNHQIIYFGTGEGWFNGDAVRGLGIWKSIDGGLNWDQLSSTNHSDFFHIQKLLIHPNGDVFACTRAKGLMKSSNGGISWIQVLGDGLNGSNSARAADIEMTSNGDIYASMGIFSTDGIFKSVDRGKSWNSLNEADLNNGLPTEGYQRIELATSTNDSLVVYALFQDTESNGCMGIYRTDNGGIQWESLTVPGAIGMNDFSRGQAWYDLIAAVDPENPLTIYIGGIDLLRSIDGGHTWSQLSQWYGATGFQYMHADQHNLIFRPDSRYEAVATNDGGIYRIAMDSTNNSVTAMEYCIPQHTNCCNEYITRVRLHTLDNYSGSPLTDTDGYSDFTGISTTLDTGSMYTLIINPNFSFTDSKIGAWIDYNQDNMFSDNEQILNHSGKGLYQGDFTVPSNVASGKTRLRIRFQYGPGYIPDPCNGSGYTMGETEDYTVHIENCFEGNQCNDEQICTTNDTLDANCNCVGLLIDFDQDGNCDLLPTPVITSKNNQFNVTQFYSCAVHPESGSPIILGGTQDNGTQYFTTPGLSSTREATGGDGGFCFIDQDEPELQISSYIYNDYWITKNSWNSIDTSIVIGNNRGRFINPMDYNSEHNTLFAAYGPNYLARIRKLGTKNIIDTLEIEALDSSIISVIKVDPNNAEKLWIGIPDRWDEEDQQFNSRIVLLDKVNSDEPEVIKVMEFVHENWGYLRSIDISTIDTNRVIAVYSNYGISNVWTSGDYGESWNNAEGNLPDFPVWWVISDPMNENGAIIATELGVWFTSRLEGPTTTWKPMNDGLANVRTDMLKYRQSDHTLVAATHGRGIFTANYCFVTTNLNDTFCAGDYYEFYGNLLTESGEYEHLLETENGCDSMIILELSENPVYSDSIFQQICEGETYEFFGEVVTDSGDYEKKYLTIHGCDSLFHLTLQVDPEYYVSRDTSICEGDVYSFYGEELMGSGTYEKVFETMNGCDSIVSLNLEIHSVYEHVTTVEICAGEVYSFYGEDLTETGTFEKVFSSVSGCDSTVVVQLLVKPISSNIIETQICSGDAYNFFGEMLVESGSYEKELQAANGCDSLLTLVLSIYAIPRDTIEAQICSGEHYLFEGESLTDAGIYEKILQSKEGCDSIITLMLAVQPAYNVEVDTLICEGDVYDFYGSILTENGVYEHTFPSVEGCDSTITLDFKVKPVYIEYLIDSICLGDTYQFHGKDISDPGEYEELLFSIDGCDSLIQLNLKVNPKPILNLPDTVSLQMDEEYLLSAGSGFEYYTWSNNSMDSSIVIVGAELELGEHTYTVTVQDFSGCTNSGAVLIQVSQSTSTINDGYKSAIEIFPNPVNEIMNIKLSDLARGSKYSLIDSQGNRLSNWKTINSFQDQLDISRFASGVYYIKFVKSDKVAVEKFIKL